MKQEKGFTLIELLVVIAIIGILSAIVLISFSSPRNKAKDVSAITAMSQIRAAAEIAADGGNYSAICADTEVDRLEAAAFSANGKTPTCVHATDTWRAHVELLETTSGGTTQYFCVDSNGAAEKTTTLPTGVACP